MLENCCKMQIFCWFGSKFIEVSVISSFIELSFAIICKFSWELLENCCNMQISWCFGSNFVEIYMTSKFIELSIDEFSWELLENCCEMQIFCCFGSNLRDKTWSPILFELNSFLLQILTRTIHRIHSYVQYVFINGIYMMISVEMRVTDLGL